ncbi:myelin expression factor 2 [Nilaparvata lugens]|uniref:myelin expression factor 2 n=1 Tax=Nilaparvata lugens TaxID=108931 RepID=UPI00193CBD27|nr:myelin expression factor 2 [Nilaparvata lugens]
MSEPEIKRDRDDEKSRDRARRGDRQSSGRGGNAGGGSGGGGRERSRDRKSGGGGDKRVYISNIAYEYTWQELKDLFRQEVGDVSFVKLFVDENDKPRGCGIVEFDTPELAKKAVQRMHRYTLKDRKLVVREDNDVERDKCGRPITGNNRNNSSSNNNDRGGRNDQRSNNRNDDRAPWSGGGVGGGLGGALASLGASSNSLGGGNNSIGGEKWGNMYGLSPQFLEYLCINGPLVNAVFVANLDFKVDQKKLKEVFKLAGRVERCELSVDKDGKSRGFGVVEYSHPVEAVQAISMLHNQMLFDRRITVRLDRADKDPQQKLPQGLKGLGMGLGSNGAPLKDVANNLPSLQTFNNNLSSMMQNIASAGVPSPFAALVTPKRCIPLTIDSTARRPLGGVGGAAGIASLMGSGPGGAGAGDLSAALAGGNSAFGGGGGLGNSFGGGNQLSSQNNFLRESSLSHNFDGPGNSIGGRMSSGNDFDNMQGLSGGLNSQNSDYTRRSNLGSLNQNSGNSSNNMTDAVLVRNLPPNVTWQQLKDKFSDAGNVTYAELRGKDTGLVQFASQWEANRAINNFDRIRWDGRSLEVRFY